VKIVLVTIRKNTEEALFIVLYRHLHGRTEEHLEQPKTTISWLGYEEILSQLEI
jgi:hypothetical protein